MRRVAGLVAVVLAGASACAQAPATAPATSTQAAIVKSLQASWNTAKGYITQSAEVMPEEHYGFRPVDTVRTFGEILAHLAGANHNFCAAAKGTSSKVAEDQFEKGAKTRGEIVKALADSIAYCDSVFDGLTDAQLTDSIEMPFGMGKDARSAAILGNIGHLNEHYGNLVTYMRMKGIVPPSSRR
jgi:uncharacterized damage-inducible protein DinB